MAGLLNWPVEPGNWEPIKVDLHFGFKNIDQALPMLLLVQASNQMKGYRRALNWIHVVRHGDSLYENIDMDVCSTVHRL